MRAFIPSETALVLGGGGARGIAHIGAIGELERRGFEIAAVARWTRWA